MNLYETIGKYFNDCDPEGLTREMEAMARKQDELLRRCEILEDDIATANSMRTDSLALMAHRAYDCAVKRGKIDGDNVTKLLNDIDDELSEALSAACDGDTRYVLADGELSVTINIDPMVELCDVLIATLTALHTLVPEGISIDELVAAKMRYNERRDD